MPRYKLTLEYNGSGTIGWQKQTNEISIQSLIEAALKAYCGAEVEVVGAGRTDAGVHAIAQSAHVDLPKNCDTYSIMQGANYHLYMQTGANDETRCVPKIAVLSAEEVPDEFHARFSATKRHYVYRILNRRARPVIEAGKVWHVPEELDLKAMQEACRYFLGHHDFSSFRDTQCQAKSPLKTLDSFRFERVSAEELRFYVSARSFLHHQVRIMVGTVKAVGNGKFHPSDIKEILAKKSRLYAGPTAPAEGLYLTGVEY